MITTQKTNTQPIQSSSIQAPFIQKPKLRGIFHCIAFFFTCASLIIFTISSVLYKFNIGIFIYLISQLLQFGISSFYHIPAWKPKTKLILQYLDHACIFLLISGTQTSFLLNSIPVSEKQLVMIAIKVTWTITILGISRIFLFKRLYDIFDLVCYIVHGLAILPFIRLLSFITIIERFLVFFGAAFYIIGGIIYGAERPNPFPNLFGYHEIFHIFTIIANTCFGVVITKDYISGLFKMTSNSCN